MALNYVRFMRGELEAYKFLKENNRLDENTLYFIYDASNPSAGSLYMGSRAISGGDIIFENATLKDLQDVLVDTTKENSFLVQKADGKWDNMAVEQVAQLLKGYLDFKDVQLQETVNTLTTNVNLLQAKVETLESSIENVYNKTEVDTLISNINSLKREIVDSVDAIDVQSAQALTTIYMIPIADAFGNNKYDEYIVVEKDGIRSIESFGSSFNVDLSDYAKKEDILIKQVSPEFLITEGTLSLNKITIAKVENLQEQLDILSANDNIFTTDIAQIKEAIVWQDIV